MTYIVIKTIHLLLLFTDIIKSNLNFRFFVTDIIYNYFFTSSGNILSEPISCLESYRRFNYML